MLSAHKSHVEYFDLLGDINKAANDVGKFAQQVGEGAKKGIDTAAGQINDTAANVGGFVNDTAGQINQTAANVGGEINNTANQINQGVTKFKDDVGKFNTDTYNSVVDSFKKPAGGKEDKYFEDLFGLPPAEPKPENNIGDRIVNNFNSIERYRIPITDETINEWNVFQTPVTSPQDLFGRVVTVATIPDDIISATPLVGPAYNIVTAVVMKEAVLPVLENFGLVKPPQEETTEETIVEGDSTVENSTSANNTRPKTKAEALLKDTKAIRLIIFILFIIILMFLIYSF